jgi:GAF domain-containing protein
VQLEVVELVHDLLARLAGEEVRVLEHWSVHALEAERPRDGTEVIEQPLAETEVLGVEVPCAAGRLQGLAAHPDSNITTASPPRGVQAFATPPLFRGS